MQSLRCMLTPLPLVVYPMISSPGTGLQHFDILMRSPSIPLTMVTRCGEQLSAAGERHCLACGFGVGLAWASMEFYAGEDGSIRYLGLSLFHTANGAYTGNILATENKKREMISRYISIELLDSINENICSSLPAILKGFRG